MGVGSGEDAGWWDSRSSLRGREVWEVGSWRVGGGIIGSGFCCGSSSGGGLRG